MCLVYMHVYQEVTTRMPALTSHAGPTPLPQVLQCLSVYPWSSEYTQEIKKCHHNSPIPAPKG